MKDLKELKVMAFKELVQEIKDDIEAKKNEYERLEINRLKEQMKQYLCLDFNGKTDGINLQELYETEDKIKKEINYLEYKLDECENELKRHWKISE